MFAMHSPFKNFSLSSFDSLHAINCTKKCKFANLEERRMNVVQNTINFIIGQASVS